MKILVLANNDVGLYQFRRELLGELMTDHAVTIALPYGPMVEPLTEAGCQFADTPMDRRGINPLTDARLVGRYHRLLRKIGPDLVISYTIKPNIYGGILSGLRKIPYAVNITGLGTAFQKPGLLRRFVTALYRIAIKNAKVVFFENSANMDLFVMENIVRREKCCLLSGAGVNLQHYSVARYPQEEPVRFLFMGRVMKEKGFEELCWAMERLRKAGYSCCLDVVGSCEENYTEAIRGYEVQGWMNYHGYQRDVRPFVEKAHCFVLPSYHEGMANTNLECAAMGRPVITSNIPGCREAVVEGRSGLLCIPKDAESLYQAMEQFLQMTPDAREKMGLAGRRHMEMNFDKKAVVHQTVSMLMN